MPPNSKIEKKLRRNRLLDAGWLTNWARFQGAQPDHVRVESSSCCFPRELVSFDPRHVIRSPIRKRIELGGTTSMSSRFLRPRQLSRIEIESE